MSKVTIKFWNIEEGEYVEGDELVVSKDGIVQELEYVTYQSTGGDYNLLDVNSVVAHFYKDGERIA